MEEEFKIEFALYIIQLKIVDLISNKPENYKNFKLNLNQLIDEREKIYKQDSETINKVYNQYKKQIIDKREKI